MTDQEDSAFRADARGIIAISHPRPEPRRFATAAALAGESDFNRLRAGLITVAFVRFEEIHFEFGSSFLLPSEFDAGPLKRLLERHAGAKMAVFGHADPVGREDFNKILSGRRAAALYGVLVRDVDLWHRMYSVHDNNGRDDWGVRSIQVMLQRLGNDPGRTDGTLDDSTRDSLRDFQTAQSLPNVPFDARKQVDGVTFRMLAERYMDEICVDRGGRRFRPPPGPGVSEPEKPVPFVVKKSDFIAEGVDPDLKADVQGCSEFNPLIRFSVSEEGRFARPENATERNRENLPNRRVLILFFRPGTRIDTAQWPCPTMEEGTAGCRKRFFSDHARRSANSAARREFRATGDTFACRFFQRLHEHSAFQIVTNERLESRFALTQFEGVTRLLAESEFHSWMLVLFGADIPKNVLDSVRKELLDQKFPNCRIDVVTGGVEGHLAAYDREEKAILVDQSLLRDAERDNPAASELASVLVEEFGHFVDDRMRTELSNVGGDAPLDEGAAFGFAIANFKQDIQGRTELAAYTHDGETKILAVEYEALRQATKKFFSEQEFIDDSRTERFEFFGAGRGVNRKGQQPGASFGHESIEDVLKEVGFNDRERALVYFGNWLRDYSQAIDPKTVRPPRASAANDGFRRETLTAVLDLISRERFGNASEFEVTVLRLGLYRPEEHIDNPRGLTDSTAIDPDFRHAFAAVEGEIDLAHGLKKYIRTPGLPRPSGHKATAAEFIATEIVGALAAGRTAEGFRRLGAALHTVEDYFAHSNFVELSLIEHGHTKVFPWAGTRISGAANPALNGKFPIVTGMFGGSDTVVSILDVMGERMQKERPCEAGERGVGAKIAIILLKDKGRSEMAGKLEFALSKFEDLQRAFPGIATLTCRTTEFMLRWLKALLGRMTVSSMEGVKAAQIAFVNDPTSTDPTHTMLAKDHDDHPLHVMAASLAQTAARDIANSVNQNWLGQATKDTPINVALQYLVHPAALNAADRAGSGTLRPGLKLLWDNMGSRARDGGNAGRIKRVEGRSWMLEQFEKSKKEIEAIEKRAKEDEKKLEQEMDELFQRLKELETKPILIT